MAHRYKTVIQELGPNGEYLKPIEKLFAHRTGAYHKAFSIFLFDENNQLLLQKRSAQKYHSPNLWSNTCCSHPIPDEPSDLAAKNRLNFEMGILNCDLYYKATVSYKFPVPPDLYENELTEIFVGTTTTNPEINTDEVADYKWMDYISLSRSLQKEPLAYSVWFRYFFDEFKEDMYKLPHC